jgi:hypothetical protein
VYESLAALVFLDETFSTKECERMSTTTPTPTPQPAPDASLSTLPVPFGISADTGLPLPGLTDADLDAFAAGQARGTDESQLQRRAVDAQAAFAVLGDTDPNDLTQAGWGVIFAPSTPADVKEALQALLTHRQAQTGDTLFKVFDRADAPRPGESARDWLSRHNVSLNVVDPFQGVPFYLLIVGSPEEIPFEFQYTIDMFWGVGRIHFPTTDEYRRYAQSVVAYETVSAPPTSRQAALFATSHEFDRATQLFTSHVARPLSEGAPHMPPLGSNQRFVLRSFVGELATKDTLHRIYGGGGGLEGGAPSLVFSGSHGMGFRADDPRLVESQGALVCQDWPGFGSIDASHWFGASDVPADAKVHGLIHMIFACYGAGCPRLDNFARGSASPRQIAPEALLARLPQTLLAHPNGGALAVIGHVERAWGYSFISDRGGSQTQGFRDVMGRLLRGERAGQALDNFNIRWAALSADLSDLLSDISRGGGAGDTTSSAPNAELANRWVARDDARNYILFGDPAVRLRVEDMPQLTA